MSAIVQLDRSLINKIAAGEVVERPLSVVKELVENAIDARAGVITVEIKDGGLTQVRVTDNGGGIAAADLPLAFARHATSKIASFDDLMQVQTLGFRGEALSSIAAVAQVEMITKPAAQTAGFRVEIHGGNLLSNREIGCADGTTVIVSNLFFNTPARRKFLKKPATEAGYVSHCLERLALGNPSLIFRYINNGRLVFQTGGNGDLKTAMLGVYGREIATKTASVDAASHLNFGAARLVGLVGKPEIARGNRRHGSFFINGRYIESRAVSRAVESAFKTMLPAGKFPIYALNLELPPTALDVNVHPTKMDVRFADEEAVFAFVEDATRDALEESDLVPKIRLRRPRLEGISEEIDPEQLSLTRVSMTPVSMTQVSTRKPQIPSEPLIMREERILPPPDEKKEKIFFDYEIRGIIFSTYWLITQGDSLFLIDRHAAHERVLYENFLRKAREEAVLSQNLLVPLPLRLTPRERQILHDNRELFARFGFEISGTENPEVLSVPFLMKGPLSAAFFTDLLDKIGEVGFSKTNPLKNELIAMAACKAAIKAGDAANEAEADELVEQLLALENPFTCPHGRPTIIEITKNELERRFKR